MGELIGTATPEKDGLLKNINAIRMSNQKGFAFDFTESENNFWSTNCAIELYVYSNGFVCLYTILASPYGIIIKYIGNNNTEFKKEGNMLYAKCRDNDCAIRWKMNLGRYNPPSFKTDDGSTFDTINADKIIPVGY